MDVSLLTNQVVVSSIIVALLQHVKKASWFPWLTAETEKLNRVVAVLLSFLAAVGVHASFTNHTLTITGLSLVSILTLGWNWIVSFVIQQGIFKATVGPALVQGETIQMTGASWSMPVHSEQQATEAYKQAETR